MYKNNLGIEKLVMSCSFSYICFDIDDDEKWKHTHILLNFVRKVTCSFITFAMHTFSFRTASIIIYCMRNTWYISCMLHTKQN